MKLDHSHLKTDSKTLTIIFNTVSLTSLWVAFLKCIIPRPVYIIPAALVVYRVGDFILELFYLLVFITIGRLTAFLNQSPAEVCTGKTSPTS